MRNVFQKKQKDKLMFMPFWMCGYPNIDDSIKKMELLLEYCDILEIGIPFSDPIADGVVIQNASKIAIENGFNTENTFEIIKKANQKHQKPVVILCYLNTILQYGIEKFMKAAKESNVNAVLIPDLPPEESEIIKKYLNGIEIIYIISTNTSIERIKYIDNISNSFIYFISKPSVTGISEKNVEESTIKFINEIKFTITNPLYIGFGISNLEQIKQYSQTSADGIIIGSKLISLDSSELIESFISDFKKI